MLDQVSKQAIIIFLAVCIIAIIVVGRLGFLRLKRMLFPKVSTREDSSASTSERAGVDAPGGFTDRMVRIEKILGATATGSREQALACWFRYLRRNLTFPLNAELVTSSTLIPAGRVVLVRRPIGVNLSTGVLIQVHDGEGIYEIPIDSIRLQSGTEHDDQLLGDYTHWLHMNRAMP